MEQGQPKRISMDMYRKTALIEAYHYPFSDDVPQEFRNAVKHNEAGEPYITTLEGDSYLMADSWLARGPHGEFWRIADDVFAETYVQA
jgi:hypothetical protein